MRLIDVDFLKHTLCELYTKQLDRAERNGWDAKVISGYAACIDQTGLAIDCIIKIECIESENGGVKRWQN